MQTELSQCADYGSYLNGSQTLTERSCHLSFSVIACG